MTNQNNYKICNKNIQGFTLVELMVALSIFAVIMMISLSILLNSIRMTRVIAHQARAVDNISLAVEQMAREVRMGSSISGANGRQNNFSFISYDGHLVTYSICGTRMCRNNRPITDETIMLTGGFYMQHMQTIGRRMTPRITVALRAADVRGNIFGIVQTTVSARLIHYKL